VSKPKVLYVVHGHPDVAPGGAEAYALQVYEAFRGSGALEPVLVARAAPGPSDVHPGTPFGLIGDDPNQYFVFTDAEGFDFFYLSRPDKTLYTNHFADFLRAHRPDLVHFQHTQFIGCDLITQVRRTLPEVPIVYTLHEFLPICHRDGQMVRTKGNELCLRSSPRRCSECFPSFTPQDFYLRKRFVQSHFAHVDLFLTPSRFLLDRYVAWGIPTERIRHEPLGIQPAASMPDGDEDRPRTRFGFFGQLSQYKGADVLLQAMELLAETDPEIHLWVNGANLEIQPESFQDRLRKLLAATEANVTVQGKYDHSDLPKLMQAIDWVVIPSVWWENSPLVIREAFLHGRPVICSDIGGMAEQVNNEVDGLHFRVGDVHALAQTMRRAANTPRLWEKLNGGIPDVLTVDDHARRLDGVYRELMEWKGHSEDAAPDS
jgi:glycosyltransferase involved in cell wall biosynthesis